MAKTEEKKKVQSERIARAGRVLNGLKKLEKVFGAMRPDEAREVFAAFVSGHHEIPREALVNLFPDETK